MRGGFDLWVIFDHAIRMGQFCLVPHGRDGKNCTRTNGTGEKSMAQSQDITAAKQTYEGFIRLIKISTPLIAILAAFVVYLISR